MARATPKAVLEMIRLHNGMRNSINQRSGYSTKEKIVALQAINELLEGVIHANNCYAGFAYVNRAGGIIYDLEPYYRPSGSHPGLRVLPPESEYSRQYYTVTPAPRIKK